MKLGIRTDTLDITGEVLETAAYTGISEEDVIEAFKAYRGRISQVPPKYSALKIGGRRAYELAREGKDFEIKTREIEIFSNEILRLDIEHGEIEFDVSCSKGTYIRTICDDIGRALGCGAVMTALERTESGYFKLENAVDIEELCSMSDEEIARHVIPMDLTLERLGVVQLDDFRVKAFINGNSTHSNGYRIDAESEFNNSYKVYNASEFLGIARVDRGELKPEKILV